MARNIIRQRYLENKGFQPREARELSHSSRAGMKAPYFRRMVRSRLRLIQNAKRYGWSDKKLQDYINRKYVEQGWLDHSGEKSVWAMLRDFEQRGRARGEEYDSPWRQDYRRKGKKKAKPRITRKDMIKSTILKLNRQMEREKNPDKQDALLGERQRYQKILDRMESG